MDRRQLEQHLRLHGCVLHDHGAKHDVWINPINLGDRVNHVHLTNAVKGAARDQPRGK